MDTHPDVEDSLLYQLTVLHILNQGNVFLTLECTGDTFMGAPVFTAPLPGGITTNIHEGDTLTMIFTNGIPQPGDIILPQSYAFTDHEGESILVMAEWEHADNHCDLCNTRMTPVAGSHFHKGRQYDNSLSITVSGGFGMLIDDTIQKTLCGHCGEKILQILGE